MNKKDENKILSEFMSKILEESENKFKFKNVIDVEN